MQKDDSKITSFTDLITWQEGHKLVLMVYKKTEGFPSEEKFSLTSQIRRAVVSVTSNIAEGFGRQTNRDKVHFYVMARGSILELQNQLIIARDISILNPESFKKLSNQAVTVHKLMNGLIRSINANTV